MAVSLPGPWAGDIYWVSVVDTACNVVLNKWNLCLKELLSSGRTEVGTQINNVIKIINSDIYKVPRFQKGGCLKVNRYWLSSASCVPYCAKLLGMLSQSSLNQNRQISKITQLLTSRFQIFISNFKDHALNFCDCTFLFNIIIYLAAIKFVVLVRHFTYFMYF